jgi:hypothetical protein
MVCVRDEGYCVVVVAYLGDHSGFGTIGIYKPAVYELDTCLFEEL